MANAPASPWAYTGLVLIALLIAVCTVINRPDLAMKPLCWIFGHLPYIEDTPETVRVERQGVKFVIGPTRRYCRRCGAMLEGDESRARRVPR